MSGCRILPTATKCTQCQEHEWQEKIVYTREPWELTQKIIKQTTRSISNEKQGEQRNHQTCRYLFSIEAVRILLAVYLHTKWAILPLQIRALLRYIENSTTYTFTTTVRNGSLVTNHTVIRALRFELRDLRVRFYIVTWSKLILQALHKVTCLGSFWLP